MIEQLQAGQRRTQAEIDDVLEEVRALRAEVATAVPAGADPPLPRREDTSGSPASS